MDARYAVRTLLRTRGFTAAAIVCLGLGIGANTAVFSVFNATLLRPLPYRDADRLMTVYETNVKRGALRSSVCPADFLDWRREVSAVEALAAYRGWQPNLTGVEQAERLPALEASGSLFQVLGVSPFAGRVFLPEDERARRRVAVISYSLWQRVFGSDPALVGRSVRLNGESHEVIGIMPAEFQFPTRGVELWRPLLLDREAQDRGEHSLLVLARLKPGFTRDQARAELGTIMKRLEREYPVSNDGCSAGLIPIRDWFVGQSSRQTLWLLLGAVTLVLLTASANVSSLQLARGAARRREFAVRAALGASRSRIAAQLTVESLTLSLVGGALGLLLALWSRDALIALTPDDSPFRLVQPVIDWRVLAFTLAAALASALLFGIAPAYRHARGSSILTGPTRATPSWWLASFLVLQAALTMTLLVAAGLLLRSFANLYDVDRGFSSANVLTTRLSLPPGRTDERRVAFYEDVVRRIAANPDTVAAAAMTHVPLSGVGNSGFVSFEGRPAHEGGTANHPGADRLIVTPGVLQALEIPLREGRLFDDRDAGGAPPSVIVNRAFVDRYFPGETAIGRRIKRGTLPAPFPWLTIVGVVENVKHRSVLSPAAPTIYLPHSQTPEGSMTLVVKSRATDSVAAANIRAAVKAVDPDQPVSVPRSADDLVLASLASRWLPMLWMAAFAGLALVLAAIGMYGAVSYTVVQRRREFGIRVALGATRADLVRLALGRGVSPAAVGAILGLGAAAATTGVLNALLYDVSRFDVLTYGAAALMLVGVAVAASYPPARRSSVEDATIALKQESHY